MSSFLRRSIAIVIVAAVVVALIDFPFARIPLAMGLCVYGAILYFYPYAWLIVLPALLPLLDLTPWSGRFFFDEFDFFVLLTLSIGLWRNDHSPAESRGLPTSLLLALIPLTISYVVSLMVGLVPLQPLDANAFSNYYSHYNSLRMGKGYFEALAVILLFLRRSSEPDQIANSLVKGMVLGLAGVTIAVVWERLLFTGLFDFASDFRVTATFSGLHNGGNDPEAYLVLAQPFLFAWALSRRKLLTYVAGLGLFVASTYALLMTFSRGGYLGLGITWVALFFCFLWRGARYTSYRGVIISIFFLGAAAVATIPVFKGSYVRSRFASVREDWNIRLDQAAHAIGAMDGNWQTRMFGMGLGRYPAIFYLRKPLPIMPATYEFEQDKNNVFLRLFPGSPLYFEQYLGVESREKYTLEIRIRAATRAGLLIYVCEKNLLYSFRCATPVRYNVESFGNWTQQNNIIDMGEIGEASGPLSWISTRPVKFTLYAPGPEPVDVDDVRLIDRSGHNHIDNGDFAAGIDRWFFSTDDHLAWQVKNHWAHVYFEQGMLGIFAFFLFSIYVLAYLLLRVARGNGFAGIPLASIIGFLTVGFFGFLFDTPRIALLFFLVSLSSLVCEREAATSKRAQ